MAVMAIIMGGKAQEEMPAKRPARRHA